MHCEEICCCSWSQDSTAEEVACPKRALLIQLATQRECCVTSTSMRCLVFSGLRLRQTRRNSCPSSHKPPMLVKMNGRHDDSVRRRPCSSVCFPPDFCLFFSRLRETTLRLHSFRSRFLQIAHANPRAMYRKRNEHMKHIENMFYEGQNL